MDKFSFKTCKDILLFYFFFVKAKHVKTIYENTKTFTLFYFNEFV